MAVQFIIKHKITAKDSSNVQHAGQHWAKRKKTVDYWHKLTRLEIARQLPKRKPFDVPVILEFKFRSRLDCTNHSSIVKYIEDAMKGILIKDDTRKYVQGCCMYFAKDDDVEGDIIVTVREVE